MLRTEYQAGTALGVAAYSVMSAGGLVGDDLVNQMLARRLEQPDCRNGALLDGYPRTLPQANFLDRLTAESGQGPITVLHLDVPAAVLIQRMAARRYCPTCQRTYNLLSNPPKFDTVCDVDGTPLIERKDDSEAVIAERLRGYEQVTNPIVAHYAGPNYHRIDGNRPPAEIEAEIEAILAPVMIRVGRRRA
jgi:adenylate kinase